MGELERNRLSEREKHLLRLRQEKLSKEEGEAKGEDGAAADGSPLPVGQKKNAKRNQNPLGVADRPVFKRKRVKVLIIFRLVNGRNSECVMYCMYLSSPFNFFTCMIKSNSCFYF